MTVVAAAPHMPPGRATGAAATPGIRPKAQGYLRPPPGEPGEARGYSLRALLSSPLGTRLASGVAPVGGVRAANERLPHPPLAEPGRGAAAYGRGAGLFESRIARIARRQKAAIRAESRGAQ